MLSFRRENSGWHYKTRSLPLGSHEANTRDLSVAQNDGTQMAGTSHDPIWSPKHLGLYTNVNAQRNPLGAAVCMHNASSKNPPAEHIQQHINGSPYKAPLCTAIFMLGTSNSQWCRARNWVTFRLAPWSNGTGILSLGLASCQLALYCPFDFYKNVFTGEHLFSWHFSKSIYSPV